MRMNLLDRQRAPQRRDFGSVDATLDSVLIRTVAGPCYILELNSEPDDATDRVEWHIEDEFRYTPIGRLILGEWGIGRIAPEARDQRPPTFLASFTREGAAMRLLDADGRLVSYLTLYSPRVIKPQEFPANPGDVRAALGDCYRREPDTVFEFVPCRGWHNPSSSQMVPLGDSLLPIVGTVYYLPYGGAGLEFFPIEAVVVNSRAAKFVIFDGCELFVYQLNQREAHEVARLLSRTRVHG